MLTPDKTQEVFLKDFMLRPATVADTEEIVEVINAFSMKLEGIKTETAEQYRVFRDRPDINRETDSRVATTPDGRIVGVAEVWFTPPYVRTFLSARVHPDYWGCGIDAALVHWGEGRAREMIQAAPEGTRVTLGYGILSTHEAAQALFLAEGFQPVRHFFEMRIDFDGPPPAPVWPEGIVIRTMTLDRDEEAIFRALDEAFRDHWGHVEGPFEARFSRFMHFIKNHPDLDPSLFFLAMAGDEIAGVSLCLPRTTEDPDMAWVDDLGVRRPWRKQGLGLALLHHSFTEFYRRGIPRAGLGVDASNLTGALRLYQRAGMSPFRQFDIYEKELRAGKDLATQAVEA